MDVSHRRLPHLAESASWFLGLAGMLVWGAFHLDAVRSSEADITRFAALQSLATENPDISDWSIARVFAWRKAIKEAFPAPLAVLRVRRLAIEVAVLPGTDDHTLDRGLGHIEDTALPGTDGNSGIAGHRDGFFRALKDILPGDTIELDTLEGKDLYRVERTWVVNPDDVSVLDPTPARSLTLVTCYPFYFVGSAPQRFIVRAVHIGGERMVSRVREQSGSNIQPTTGRVL